VGKGEDEMILTVDMLSDESFKRYLVAFIKDARRREINLDKFIHENPELLEDK
jgi:hypothetical protein